MLIINSMSTRKISRIYLVLLQKIIKDFSLLIYRYISSCRENSKLCALVRRTPHWHSPVRASCFHTIPHFPNFHSCNHLSKRKTLWTQRETQKQTWKRSNWVSILYRQPDRVSRPFVGPVYCAVSMLKSFNLCKEFWEQIELLQWWGK